MSYLLFSKHQQGSISYCDDHGVFGTWEAALRVAPSAHPVASEKIYVLKTGSGVPYDRGLLLWDGKKQGFTGVSQEEVDAVTGG